MAEFSVSFWVEIDAASYEEAHKMADEMEQQIADRVSYAQTVGIIDVECADPEELDEEEE